MVHLIHMFVKAILIVLFALLTTMSLLIFLSNETGTSLKVEYDSTFPDFTLCPFDYETHVEKINSKSGHNMSEVNKLIPSMKDMILLIQKGEINQNHDEKDETT